MNFTNKELAQFMIANYKGQVTVPAHFSVEGKPATAEQAITNAFHQIMGTNQDSTIMDYKRALRNPQVQLGLFAVIEEVLNEGFIKEEWQIPFFEQFVETRSQARGDKTVFYVKSRNEVVVSRVAKDGKVELDRQRFDEGHELTVKTETYAVKVYEHLARIMLGRSTWGEFVAKMYEAKERFIAEKCYATFANVVENLPNQFVHRGSYDAAKIKEVIRNVKLLSGASSVTLLGTELALEALTQDDSIKYLGSADVQNEIYRTGRLGFWHGNPCIELQNGFKTGTGLEEMVLSDKVVYIIPNVEEKPCKLVLEPELLDINEANFARVDDAVELAIRFSFGVNVITGNAIGAFIISE